MLKFATEFPVSSQNSVTDFLNSAKTWVLRSPHTEFTSSDLDELEIQEEKTYRNQHEAIEVISVVTGSSEHAAFRYIKVNPQDKSEWHTTIACHKEEGEMLVSVKVANLISGFQVNGDPFKQPRVISQLLSDLGGGKDGEVFVSESPLYLEHNKDQIFLAGRCMNRKSGLTLPVVYLSSRSASSRHRYSINPNSLAKALSGCAHVLVEPNRSFSNRLMYEVDFKNTYGGVVGVYWPEGSLHLEFDLDRCYTSQSEMKNEIVSQVQDVLLKKRINPKCTWAYVKELQSKKKIEALKSSDNSSLEDYILAFDDELDAKDSRIKEAEREILRLRAEVETYQSKLKRVDGIHISTGDEQDLYPDETIGVILACLSEAKMNVHKNSRREHIIEAILCSNTAQDSAAEIKNVLKSLLSSYRTMNSRLQAELQNNGFSVAQDGKHIRIIYRGDERYAFTMPKTGSDNRGGKNLVSDICNKIL